MTGIRVPATHGAPPMISGSITTRSIVSRLRPTRATGDRVVPEECSRDNRASILVNGGCGLLAARDRQPPSIGVDVRRPTWDTGGEELCLQLVLSEGDPSNWAAVVAGYPHQVILAGDADNGVPRNGPHAPVSGRRLLRGIGFGAARSANDSWWWCPARWAEGRGADVIA